jgi:hypothetical protein
MSCPICASAKQVEYSVEMMVHRAGLTNLNNSSVLVIQKL